MNIMAITDSEDNSKGGYYKLKKAMRSKAKKVEVSFKYL